MENKAECFSTQLVDENGNFNRAGLEEFIQNVKLAECGSSHAVVSIIGPQSTGKSTLLNNLFHTNFEEMDYMKAASQTTKGIWIARCADIEPCTIVMDIEGIDGKERGQGDTTFENQSAFFALDVSDIVLFNVFYKDLGREHGGCKPLLKTTFQVMLKSMTNSRKTTFMVIIRDKSKTPFEIVNESVRKDMQKIWDSILKPEALKNTLLSDYLNLQVVALSSYEYQKEEFEEQVVSLRQNISQSIAPGGLAGDRQTRVPGSGFLKEFNRCLFHSFTSVQKLWEDIKKKKELNLPSHKVLVASARCDQIVDEIYSSFLINKDWVELEKAVKSKSIPSNGHILSSLLKKYLSSYDKEAIDNEESVKYIKRQELEQKLLRLVQPTYHLMLEHTRSSTLNDFKIALKDDLNGGQGFAIVARDCSHKCKTLFDEKCKDVDIGLINWELTEIRGKFSRDLDSHLTQVKTAKLSVLATEYESTLKQRVCKPVETFLKEGNDDTWRKIRNLVSRETMKVISEFEHSGFEMDEQAKEIKSNLINYARRLVEETTRHEVKIASIRMNERFTSLFNYDKYKEPRIWAVDVNIKAITNTTYLSCLKLLSVLAAIRLDEDEPDTIFDTLVRALDDPNILMASDTWKNVTKTLITPIECKSRWDEFQTDTNYYIIQAKTSRKANKQKKIIKNVVVGASLIAVGGIVGSGVAVAAVNVNHGTTAAVIAGTSAATAALTVVDKATELVSDVLKRMDDKHL